MVKRKNLSNGFCLQSCMSSKSPVNLACLKLSIFRENCTKLKFRDAPEKILARILDGWSNPRFT